MQQRPAATPARILIVIPARYCLLSHTSLLTRDLQHLVRGLDHKHSIASTTVLLSDGRNVMAICLKQHLPMKAHTRLQHVRHPTCGYQEGNARKWPRDAMQKIEPTVLAQDYQLICLLVRRSTTCRRRRPTRAGRQPTCCVICLASAALVRVEDRYIPTKSA